MASQTEVNQLIGRAMIESDFRGRLLKDPIGTAREAGIGLTPSQADFIGKIDPGQMDAVAAEFLKAAHWNEVDMRPLW